MLGPIVTFIPTSDFQKARAFYEGVLGLALAGEDAFAMTFDAKGVTIRVTKVEKFTPQPFTVLGWEVESAAGVVEKLKAKGVTFERYPFLKQDSAGIWPSPSGAKVAWFKDPDGNVLSITEL